MTGTMEMRSPMQFNEKTLQAETLRQQVLRNLDKLRQLVGINEDKYNASLKGAFGVSSAQKLEWEQIGIAFSVLEKMLSGDDISFCEAAFSEKSHPDFSADLTNKV